jgi:hypothetical protein
MASRLVEAVAGGDKAAVFALLQRGQPEWPNEAVSAVERASVAKRGQIVRMLVLSGADPNCIFSDGLTALHHAAQQDDRETARFLLQQGAYANPAPLPVPGVPLSTDKPLDLAIGNKELGWILKRGLMLENWRKVCGATSAHAFFSGTLLFLTLWEYIDTFRWMPSLSFLLIIIWAGSCYCHKEAHLNNSFLPKRQDGASGFEAMPNIVDCSGYLPKDTDGAGLICPQCNIKRPFRAAHCHFSGRCIQRYDHFCHFVGVPVGPRNQLFVFFGIFLTIIWSGWLTILNFVTFTMLSILLGCFCATITAQLALYMLGSLRASASGLTIREHAHQGEPGFAYVSGLSSSFRQKHGFLGFLNFLTDPAYLQDRNLQQAQRELQVGV